MGVGLELEIENRWQHGRERLEMAKSKGGLGVRTKQQRERAISKAGRRRWEAGLKQRVRIGGRGVEV